MLKRVFDLFFASVGILVLSPIFFVAALAIKLESKGPVFFRQERVGQHGKLFKIHKLRTMSVGQEASQLTVGADKRITRVGFFLRRSKLDELAQLIDVVLGDMSLVGPRPEVPKYVAYYPLEVRDIVLSVKPGITDHASIAFKDENAILGLSKNPEKTYIEEIIPIKLNFYVNYVKSNTLLGDLLIIFATLKAIIN
jgi:lipopolysaccharide/colanic/teichoic acid biosynthesis glycosyltransferase